MNLTSSTTFCLSSVSTPLRCVAAYTELAASGKSFSLSQGVLVSYTIVKQRREYDNSLIIASSLSVWEQDTPPASGGGSSRSPRSVFAGTRKGITALQMDIKIGGLTREILEQAMEQARQGGSSAGQDGRSARRAAHGALSLCAALSRRS